MRNRLEAGYGSPLAPEVTGMAQVRLAGVENAPFVPSVDELTLPNQARYDSNEDNDTVESHMLAEYRQHFNGKLDPLRKVYNTEMVPEGFGVELGFETNDGRYFNSVAPCAEQAMQEGLSYFLLENHLE